MLKKISINTTFYVALILTVIFKVYEIFFYFFIFVFLHELAHIFVAKKFGLNIKKIIITPIGQIAVIDNIEKLELYKKIFIVSVGVLLNIILALFFNMFTNEKMQLMKNINLSIAFFNCLPIFPLDGGRFFCYILGSKIGDLKASIILKKISLFGSFIMFLLGFIQIILYPYNVSLLCLSLYFIKVNKSEYIYQFYKAIINKQQYEKSKILKIKQILIDKDYENKDIVLILSSDYYLIINVSINGNIYFTLNEKVFLDYIQKYGINGTIYNVVKKLK
ncbi:site-2 protease family protein [[Clostridium] colinum]|uniref:site-2 protease family protein n=1 Tax=[Clostridium] colinum TaxID=36835 RepID=UPI002025B572|nr:site-2 protease family protein [[Clostridium] colinum]